MMIIRLFSFLIFSLFVFNTTVYAQSEKISIDSLELENSILLFERYEIIGKKCENKNGLPAFCDRETRLFDNNLQDLIFMHEQALSFLNFQYEIIDLDQVQKDIYNDVEAYRYLFKYEPVISKKGSSCFSNPGALLIRFYVYDRLTEQMYELDLDYAFFICDIDLLVNKLNESTKVEKEKK